MLNNKIPPPIVGLCIALLIVLTNRIVGFGRLEWDFLKVVAIVLVIVGLAIEVYSIALFFRARTTVNPLKPQNSNVLVVGGLYRISRNPMYLGMLLLLTGLVLWIGNVITIPLLALFVLYINRFQIKPEEQAMSTLFGEQYSEYQQRVRRWI